MSTQSSDNTLLNNLSTAVLLVGHEFDIIFLNAAAEDITGQSVRRAAGKSLFELVPGFEQLTELCERAQERGRSFGGNIHIPATQRDGSKLDLAVRVSPAATAAAGALIVELFDTTQRHQLDREEALVNQHGVSRRMLQQLAHEIRNPLGGLRGAAQLLERELSDPDLKEFTGVIISEADRLASLMDGLLGPGQKPQTEPLNVHEPLEYVATIVGSESDQLEITRDYDPSLPELHVDRHQITQALLNLVRNAAQALNGKGRIILRTRILTNQLLNRQIYKLVAAVEIEDDGPGVPPDIVNTLFYPLVTGRDGGTGLGLPLAQDLVNRHNGLIEYDSVPGRTVFTVHLPVEGEDS
ncbi:MAG: nitrogen regulation protein NR(II) [Gammaproteobacteria bacterium]|nr:nitrogen regulation protein NR(II) [Gammaproteobacteria bacterium]MDP7093113.1 nitrogen regulation protein NR(II) [Gammaproteobacteria bacterium]MDP7270992.1 nitrogen regulation protein NR(II) [Gammaproteobacteria bacterium]HJP04725.1 nitrogen regulation protein NR(II) [Gammaproteobacteria bacterium]